MNLIFINSLIKIVGAGAKNRILSLGLYPRI